MTNKAMIKHIQYINIPRYICQALIGKNHKSHHRILVGTGVMFSGVMIAQSAHFFELFILRAMCDLVGYGVHGLGTVPLVEWLMQDDVDNAE